jgi:hypothetical protein
VKKHKGPRQECVVMFCRQTTDRVEGTEHICPKHWAMIDRRLRRIYHHLRRKMIQMPRSGEHFDRLIAIAHRNWARMKAQATDRELTGRSHG